MRSDEEIDAKPEPPSDEQPAPRDELARDSQLADHQFRLIGLFALMTACAAYFFLEKVHGGQFGLHALGGVALVVGIALPALWVTAWIVRGFLDGGLIRAVVLVVALAGAVVACLTQFPGF